MSRHFPRAFKWSLAAVTFMVLLVSFQNCSVLTSPLEFESKANGNDVTSTDSGNGGTYDGKPSGTFVRRSPAPCAQGSDWIGVMKFGPMNAELLDDLCVVLSYVVELVDTRLEYSKFNPDFVGLNGAIFERSEAVDPSVNAPYVDLWCHHQDSQFGLDVVVKTSSTTNSSESIVYVGENLASVNPQLRKLNPRPAIKSVSTGRVVATTSDGSMTTEIDLSSPNEFEHPGRTTIRLDDRNLDLAMTCRVVNDSPAVLVKPSNALAIYQMNQALGAAPNGTSISDSSRNGRNAVLQNQDDQGARFVSGLLGNALSFDGVDDSLDLTPLSPLAPGDFTFSAWVQPSAVITDKAVLFGAFDTVNFMPSYYNLLRVGFGLCDPKPDPTADRVELTLDMAGVCYTTGIRVVDGQWHMVTLTVRGAQATLFIDGLQVGQYAITTTRNPATDKWALGQDWDSATNANDRYNGLVDEVYVWNLSLDAAEVVDVFKNSGR